MNAPLPFDCNSIALSMDGAKIARGMPAQPDITDEQLLGLQHFIRKTARNHLQMVSKAQQRASGH